MFRFYKIGGGARALSLSPIFFLIMWFTSFITFGLQIFFFLFEIKSSGVCMGYFFHFQHWILGILWSFFAFYAPAKSVCSLVFFSVGCLFATALKPKSQDRATTLKLSTVSSEWVLLQLQTKKKQNYIPKNIRTKVYEKLHYFFYSDLLCIGNDTLLHCCCCCCCTHAEWRRKKACTKFSCLSVYECIYLGFSVCYLWLFNLCSQAESKKEGKRESETHQLPQIVILLSFRFRFEPTHPPHSMK